MKLYNLLLIISINLNLFAAAITYKLSNGRFGDNLLAYAHAKYFSYKYNIPLIYKKFPYSDKLKLDQIENFKKNFKQIKTIKHESELDSNQDVLYAIPYYSEVKFEYKTDPKPVSLEVDWECEEFKHILVQCISPNRNIKLIELPKNKISVAVHLRRGGSFDNPLFMESRSTKKTRGFADLHRPLKFPPLSFYVDQLREISNLFKSKKLYVFIFTDDLNPKILVEKIKKELLDYKNLEFDFRSKNSDKMNVLEDFFSMTKFDCLIRPESNFSIMASKISNYVVEIYPKDQRWEGNKSIITEVNKRINEEKLEDLLK